MCVCVLIVPAFPATLLGPNMCSLGFSYIFTLLLRKCRIRHLEVAGKNATSDLIRCMCWFSWLSLLGTLAKVHSRPVVIEVGGMEMCT